MFLVIWKILLIVNMVLCKFFLEVVLEVFLIFLFSFILYLCIYFSKFRVILFWVWFIDFWEFKFFWIFCFSILNLEESVNVCFCIFEFFSLLVMFVNCFKVIFSCFFFISLWSFVSVKEFLIIVFLIIWIV